jgi:hypothetical protein
MHDTVVCPTLEWTALAAALGGFLLGAVLSLRFGIAWKTRARSERRDRER